MFAGFDLKDWHIEYVSFWECQRKSCIKERRAEDLRYGLVS